MAQILGRKRAGRWVVNRIGGGALEPAADRHAWEEGRRAVWRMARDLGTRASAWDLEYFKACTGPAESTIGYASAFAQACRSADSEVLLVTPDRELGVARAAAILAAREGCECERPLFAKLADKAHFLVAASGALLALFGYVARQSLNLGPRRQVHAASHESFALAVHPEWTTRTRHLLAAIARADFVVLLGRLKRSPNDMAATWRYDGDLPPLINPVSAGAALRSVPACAALAWEGFVRAATRPIIPSLREHVALAFRVFLGAVNARWWGVHGPRVDRVLFGHTGAGDTLTLERAMQENGATTVHVVHGLATGPNFFGVSDVAVFRSGHDAKQYTDLGCYGQCVIQEAATPQLRRGTEGILLLSNLAHPMNPRYAVSGPEDEITLLREVAITFRGMSLGAGRMFWKPHPVIGALPPGDAKAIRAEAVRLGFQEIPDGAPILPAASAARWVVSSVSTVTLDLLVQGVLSVVHDVQDALLDSAVGCFPVTRSSPELAQVLEAMDAAGAYERQFERTWKALLPGRPFSPGAKVITN